MKTLWAALMSLRSLKKSDLWPLVTALIGAVIDMVKKKPGASERLFAAIMALLVFVLATYYTPQMVGPAAYRGGQATSGLLTPIIPRWQDLELVAAETIPVAATEYVRGLKSDNA